MPTLLEFLQTFDRATLQSRVQAADAKRAELRTLFPPEALGSLTLERYGIGQDDANTLCRLLEFGSDELGSIRGGSSFKFLVYRRKADGVWISKLKGEPDAARAWVKLRTDLTHAVELCRAGDFEKLDALQAARNIPAARTKLMHVYFPEEVLSVYSFGHLEHYISQLGGEFERGKDRYTACANRQLLGMLRAMPELAGWSAMELGILLWTWNPPAKPKPQIPGPPDEGPRMMKIAPGEKGRLWDECRSRGCIAVGWNEMGDLWQYPDLESFIARFQELYQKSTGKGRASNDETAERLWQLRELEEGDLIVANKGTSTILAVGNVSGPVRYEPGGFEYHIVVPVEWDTSFQRVIPPQKQWAFFTIGWLDPKLRDMILSPPPPPPPPPAPVFSLNRILYGPPGTGKTYSVIRDAVEICDGVADESTVRQRFAELSTQGRVRFVTFHQSYAYEDFMEGIRPVLDESGRAGFEMKAGVFKELAAEAGFSCLEGPFSAGERSKRTKFDQLLTKLSEQMDEEGEIEIDGLAKGCRVKVRRRSPGVLDVVLPSGNVGACLKSVVAAVYEKLGDKKRIHSGEALRAYGRQSHHNAVAAVFNYLQTLPQPTAAAPAPEAAAASSDPEERAAILQDFLMRGEASGWRLRAEVERARHVLIIDEINRGNISRVFGELITLIEDDKRMGTENALTLTLPASRDLFSVPPNLHLLGTMNTADKSLALLDVALRRRFEFEELTPDFGLCPDLPEEMAKALDRLNDRLERRRDRDHRIGHAFFMDVSDAAGFNEVFRRKVVPLLQEYFFTDVDGARYVLGEEERKDSAGFLRELEPHGDSKWARQRWRWFTDEDPDFDCWARLQETLGS